MGMPMTKIPGEPVFVPGRGLVYVSDLLKESADRGEKLAKEPKTISQHKLELDGFIKPDAPGHL